MKESPDNLLNSKANVTYTLLTYLAKFLDKLGLPGVGEGRVLLLVLGQGVGGIEAVHAEVAQQGLEEVVLGRVLEQVGLETVCADLNETRVYQVQLLLLLQTASTKIRDRPPYLLCRGSIRRIRHYQCKCSLQSCYTSFDNCVLLFEC